MKLIKSFLYLMFLAQSYNIFSAQIFGPGGLREQIIDYDKSLKRDDYNAALQIIEKIEKLDTNKVFKESSPLRNFLHKKGLYKYLGDKPFPVGYEVGSFNERTYALQDFKYTLFILRSKFQKELARLKEEFLRNLKNEIEKLINLKAQFEVAQNNVIIEAKDANEAMIIAGKLIVAEDTANAAMEQAQENANNANEFLNSILKSLENAEAIRNMTILYKGAESEDTKKMTEPINVLKNIVTAVQKVVNEAKKSAERAKAAVLIKSSIKQQLENLKVEINKVKESVAEAIAFRNQAIKILPKMRSTPIEEAKSLLKQLEELSQKVEKANNEIKVSSEKIKELVTFIINKIAPDSDLAKQAKQETDKLMQNIENAAKNTSTVKGQLDKIIKQAKNTLSEREAEEKK